MGLRGKGGASGRQCLLLIGGRHCLTEAKSDLHICLHKYCNIRVDQAHENAVKSHGDCQLDKAADYRG